MDHSKEIGEINRARRSVVDTVLDSVGGQAASAVEAACNVRMDSETFYETLCAVYGVLAAR